MFLVLDSLHFQSPHFSKWSFSLNFIITLFLFDLIRRKRHLIFKEYLPPLHESWIQFPQPLQHNSFLVFLYLFPHLSPLGLMQMPTFPLIILASVQTCEVWTIESITIEVKLVAAHICNRARAHTHCAALPLFILVRGVIKSLLRE